MRNYFILMTEAAKNLQKQISNETHPKAGSKDFESHLNDVRHYSQKFWDALFEFIQYVTCSTYPVATKVKWIGYADEMISNAFNNSNCPMTSSFEQLMKTLTQMARVDPFCRPQSYIDFFGSSTFGVAVNTINLQ